MKTILTFGMGICALLAANASLAALKVGDKAPDFKVMAATNGVTSVFSLTHALKKGPVVVYFYPKAFTSGCSLEAHQFSEAIDDFKSRKVAVIGLSTDDIPTLQRFSKADCQGKFPVGADANASIATAYDSKIPTTKMAARVSYLIGTDGKILAVHDNPSAAAHVSTMLAAAKNLK